MPSSMVLLLAALFVVLVLVSRYVSFALGTLSEAEAREAERRGVSPRELSTEGRRAARSACLAALAGPIIFTFGFLFFAAAGSVLFLSLVDGIDGARRYGPLVWQFMLYFGLIFLWLVAATVCLWLYRRYWLRE